MTLIFNTRNDELQVSIVIPIRNRLDLLEECLSSLVNQNFPLNELEVLVCDDCSEDNLSAVAKKYLERIPKIRILRQLKRKGPAAARNMGFRSANADIFVCLDSDVVCSSNFLKEITQALKTNPDWVAVEATVIPTGGSGSPLWDAPVNIKGGIFLTAASAYRSKAIRCAGGFDESFQCAACEDTDLAARLMTLGKYGFAPGAVVYHPRRRVTLRTHWQWRKHWKYVMILAKRYGFLGFPGRSASQFPRLRVALSAVVRLPARRFIEGINYVKRKPSDGALGCLYALFDIFCGLWALPNIMFSNVPPRLNYMSKDK
jgi:GT2 family glycosyltransferase